MHEQRSHHRHPIKLDLVLVYKGELHRGQTRDVSLGGMFVYTSLPLRFGTEVDIRLTIPSLKYEGEVPAVVRWHGQDGIGLAFRSLRARDMRALHQLLRSVT